MTFIKNMLAYIIMGAAFGFGFAMGTIIFSAAIKLVL